MTGVQTCALPIFDNGEDYIPSSDEDGEAGFLKESDDDGFEPLSFVLPKRGKSRAKKRPPRIWYDDRRLQAHEQLCLKMCFINVDQFRNALINLHIAQSRNYMYHRNSNVRIIVQCINENCPFYMVASSLIYSSLSWASQMTVVQNHHHHCPLKIQLLHLHLMRVCSPLHYQ